MKRITNISFKIKECKFCFFKALLYLNCFSFMLICCDFVKAAIKPFKITMRNTYDKFGTIVCFNGGHLEIYMVIKPINGLIDLLLFSMWLSGNKLHYKPHGKN